MFSIFPKFPIRLSWAQRSETDTICFTAIFGVSQKANVMSIIANMF